MLCIGIHVDGIWFRIDPHLGILPNGIGIALSNGHSCISIGISVIDPFSHRNDSRYHQFSNEGTNAKFPETMKNNKP